MNISYKWLKEFLSVDLSPKQVADDLTSIGLEVEGVEESQSIKGGLKGLVVGEVLSCEAHPNSDHLHITTVNIGQGEPLQIVCGAPNVAAGQKVIVATIGTVLYDGDQSFTIKRSKLRGVESFGMLCAEDEIGVGTSHDGIIVLPTDTPVGMEAKDYYHIENDAVIEVDITPNRSDAVSHFGCARDLAARYAVTHPEYKLIRPSVEGFKVDDHSYPIKVTVEATTACPRYCGVVVSGVTVQPSPDWLRKAIEAIGLHSINNIVDASNYVLYALGQPIHTFDADKIEGAHVIVKTLPEGTPFTTLDGIERKLNGADLVICNEKEPMCLAGVFGGLKSGITEQTTNVFIESAYFHPVSIRKTARRHGLNTDASFRYERGCDPNGTLFVLKYAAVLIQKVAGGKIACDIIDEYPQPIEPVQVELSYDYVNRLIGRDIDKSTLKTILQHLEMEILTETEDALRLSIPTYRTDVTRPADVVEDVLRIWGYDKVEPDLSLNGCLSFSPNPNSQKLQNIVANMLSASGFNEIMNNSLTKSSYYADLSTHKLENCVKLMNPLSQDLSVMRQTLLFGGLESIAFNRNHKIFNLRFYEFGNCYYYHPESHKDEVVLSSYSEDQHLSLWLCGNRNEPSWAQPEQKTSFFQLKAYVENIMRRTGVKGWICEDYEDELFRQAIAFKNRNGKVIATLGSVAASILRKMDIDTEVFYADINWNSLLKALKNHTVTYRDIPKYPKVKRDLALLIDQNVAFADIEKIARESEKNLLREVVLFDVYQGKNLEAGKKSYAVSFFLQDEEKTLKDAQIDAIMSKIQKNLETKLGAKLR